MKLAINSHYSPKSKLKKAREAVGVLRAGFWVNQLGEKIFLNPGEYSGIAGRLDDINKAFESDFSYKDIGTTKEEVIGFRNGTAHKTSARLQLELSRTLEQRPPGYNILELAKDAGFTLEEIGTTAEELKSLSKEYSRRLHKKSVDQFREWATSISNWHEEPDEFEKQLARLLSPEYYGFSYEELGTSEAECARLMRLARRREVIRWVNYLKHNAEKGDTNSSFARKMIKESLEKAKLMLSDFDITEIDLAEIERSAYVTKAKKLLAELKAPGEGWFYTDPPPTNPNFRLYRPAIWECIPGDPMVFVKKIEENLATAKAVFADIGTNDAEIKDLIRAGHLASAKFLLQVLERVSRSPRRTKFEQAMNMLGPNAMFMDDPRNPTDRKTLEEPYPIERDIQAIEYHLNGAEVNLEKIGSSRQKLQELKIAIEAR